MNAIRLVLPVTLACCLAALAAPAARPQAPSPAPRVEIPIEDVRLSDGVHRYGVRISVGGVPVLAGIDTGAAGLRLMPDAPGAATVRAGAAAETYSFGSGARLTGAIGQARIGVGGLEGAGSAHLVKAVDCIAGRPGCPGRLGLGYGFLGDGLPGEGFRVLLGGNMGPSSIDNPLMAAGARRWIIELPRPGEAGPGRLILNPTEAEVADYVTVRLVGGFREQDGGGLHDAIPGCLRHEETGARVCGVVTLDTGAFSIRVLNAGAGGAWTPGAPVAMEFMGEDRKPAVTGHLTVGGTAQAVASGAAPRRETILQLGAAPYYAWSVLYDPGRRRLGFKARPAASGLPRAQAPR